MSKYTPHTAAEEEAMLETVRVDSIEGLYSDVPASIKLKKPLNIPEGKGQIAVERDMRAVADKNKVFGTVLRGAGAYDHYIPSAVAALAGRSEFVTSYTPYQPEISQGVLQSIFEYQTMMCELTGLAVSNASVYDAGSAAAEAVNMCCDKKNTVVISGSVNPRIIEVIKTYSFAAGRKVIVVEHKEGKTDFKAIKKTVGDGQAACLVVQSPNYFGLIENMDEAAALAHTNNAKFIYVFNPISAALLKTPAECGADVAVGDGQPLGLPLSYGGAYLGILTCADDMKRRMPGRVVGQTVDNRGNTIYVLTLQAREQHIRREKALSSLCSNQAHCALTAGIYLSMVGKEGLKEVAGQCLSKAHYLASKLKKIDGIELAHKGEFFHEFTIKTTLYSAKFQKKLESAGILGGLPLSDDVSLWCVTEKADREQLDKVVEMFKEAAEC